VGGSLPGARRAATDAGVGPDARRGARLPDGGGMDRSISGPRDPVHGARHQLPGRRVARPARPAPAAADLMLQLGLFGANCSSGRTYAMLPERWVASWENNLELAKMADEIGIECMGPIARWTGSG